MSKYTRQEVIDGRKCGLKYWDRAVEKVGREAVISKAMGIHNEFPDTWGEGWPNLDWAFVNAVIEILNPKGELAMTWNLDEALTEKELDHLKTTLNLSEYVSGWGRKKEPTMKTGKTATQGKLQKLSTDKLKEMITQWLSDPSVMSAARGCLGFENAVEEQTFVSDFADPKKWRRETKEKLKEMCEDLQDSFDRGDYFGDVAGKMFERPEENSIIRMFTLKEECIGSDNFRIEITTDLTDQRVQCWDLIVD